MADTTNITDENAKVADKLKHGDYSGAIQEAQTYLKDLQKQNPTLYKDQLKAITDELVKDGGLPLIEFEFGAQDKIKLDKFDKDTLNKFEQSTNDPIAKALADVLLSKWDDLHTPDGSIVFRNADQKITGIVDKFGKIFDVDPNLPQIKQADGTIVILNSNGLVEASIGPNGQTTCFQWDQNNVLTDYYQDGQHWQLDTWDWGMPGSARGKLVPVDGNTGEWIDSVKVNTQDGTILKNFANGNQETDNLSGQPLKLASGMECTYDNGHLKTVVMPGEGDAAERTLTYDPTTKSFKNSKGFFVANEVSIDPDTQKVTVTLPAVATDQQPRQGTLEQPISGGVLIFRMDNGAEERHYPDGTWCSAADGNSLYASDIHLANGTVIKQGLINNVWSISEVDLPDGTKITYDKEKNAFFYCDKTGKELQVSQPSLPSYGSADYQLKDLTFKSGDTTYSVFPTDASLQIPLSDGTRMLKLPDGKTLKQTDDGTWQTYPDGNPFATYLIVSPTGEIIVGHLDSNTKIVTLDTYYADGKFEETKSTAYLDQTALQAAADAFIKDKSILIPMLEGISEADRLALDNLVYQQSKQHLLDTVEKLDPFNKAKGEALLFCTQEQTTDGQGQLKPLADDAGQMHKVLALMSQDSLLGEQALMSTLAVTSKADLDKMRQHYLDQYGVDPIVALQADQALAPGLREALPILLKGADVLMSATDSNQKHHISDSDLATLEQIGLKYNDVHVFGMAFQLSSREQRLAFHQTTDFAKLRRHFSGNDLMAAQDYVTDGYLSIATLVKLDARWLYIDKDLITTTLENAPSDQRDQYLKGMHLMLSDQTLSPLAGMSVTDREKAINDAFNTGKMNDNDRQSLEFYFSVQDALSRASWNENQLVDFGYSKSPTEIAKFEDHFLHERATVISVCMDELKPYFLGIGGSHYDAVAVMEHLQDISKDDWTLLKNEPTFKQELTNALQQMLSPDDFSTACRLIEQKFAAPDYISSQGTGKLSGLEKILESAGNPGRILSNIVSLSADDLQLYQGNLDIKTKVDAQIAKLNDPQKTLAQDLLKEIPGPKDSLIGFKFTFDSYQQLILDDNTATSALTTIKDVEALLASKPNPDTIAGKTYSTNLEIFKSLPFTTREGYLAYKDQHEQDPNWAELDRVCQIKLTTYNIADRAIINMKNSGTDAAGDTNVLFDTGKLPLEVLVLGNAMESGSPAQKQILFTAILTADKPQRDLLLGDAAFRAVIFRNLSPQEQEVLMLALTRLKDVQHPGDPPVPPATSAPPLFATPELLRLYALGDLGSISDTIQLLQQLKTKDSTGQALKDYAKLFHDGDDPKRPADLLTDLMCTFKDGNKEQLLNLVITSDKSVRDRLLSSKPEDVAYQEQVFKNLSPEEKEVLLHALNRLKDVVNVGDSSGTAPVLDNAERMRLYTLGDLGSLDDATKFLNSLDNDGKNINRAKAILEYSFAFHIDGDATKPRSLLADMKDRFGTAELDKITSAVTVTPEDYKQLYYNADDTWMKQSGWSAYMLFNGAREAMMAAQDKYVRDLADAAANHTDIDAKVAKDDLAHLYNSTKAYTDQKQAFTQNAMIVISTIGTMLLAPELELGSLGAALASLVEVGAAGATFEVLGKATGLGNDYDWSFKNVAGDALRGWIQNDGLLFAKPVTEMLMGKLVLPEVQTLVAKDLAGVLPETAQKTINDGMSDVLHTLLSGGEEGGQKAFAAAKSLVAKTLFPDVAVDALDAVQTRTIDIIAGDLLQNMAKVLKDTSLMKQFFVSLVAGEVTGIPSSMLAAAGSVAVSEWGKPLDKIISDAANAAGQSIGPTAISVFTFTAGATVVGVLWQTGKDKFSYKNTSSENQTINGQTVKPGESVDNVPADKPFSGPTGTEAQAKFVNREDLQTSALKVTNNKSGNLQVVDPLDGQTKTIKYAEGKWVYDDGRNTPVDQVLDFGQGQYELPNGRPLEMGGTSGTDAVPDAAEKARLGKVYSLGDPDSIAEYAKMSKQVLDEIGPDAKLYTGLKNKDKTLALELAPDGPMAKSYFRDRFEVLTALKQQLQDHPNEQLQALYDRILNDRDPETKMQDPSALLDLLHKNDNLMVSLLGQEEITRLNIDVGTFGAKYDEWATGHQQMLTVKLNIETKIQTAINAFNFDRGLPNVVINLSDDVGNFGGTQSHGLINISTKQLNWDDPLFLSSILLHENSHNAQESNILWLFISRIKQETGHLPTSDELATMWRNEFNQAPPSPNYIDQVLNFKGNVDLPTTLEPEMVKLADEWKNYTSAMSVDAAQTKVKELFAILKQRGKLSPESQNKIFTLAFNSYLDSDLFALDRGESLESLRKPGNWADDLLKLREELGQTPTKYTDAEIQSKLVDILTNAQKDLDVRYKAADALYRASQIEIDAYHFGAWAADQYKNVLDPLRGLRTPDPNGGGEYHEGPNGLDDVLLSGGEHLVKENGNWFEVVGDSKIATQADFEKSTDGRLLVIFHDDAGTSVLDARLRPIQIDTNSGEHYTLTYDSPFDKTPSKVEIGSQKFDGHNDFIPLGKGTVIEQVGDKVVITEPNGAKKEFTGSIDLQNNMPVYTEVTDWTTVTHEMNGRVIRSDGPSGNFTMVYSGDKLVRIEKSEEKMRLFDDVIAPSVTYDIDPTTGAVTETIGDGEPNPLGKLPVSLDSEGRPLLTTRDSDGNQLQFIAGDKPVLSRIIRTDNVIMELAADGTWTWKASADDIDSQPLHGNILVENGEAFIQDEHGKKFDLFGKPIA